MFGKVALKRAAMATLGAVRPRRDRHAEAQGEQAGAAWTIVDEHPASDDFGAAGRRQPAARSKRARRALMALLVFLAVAASVAAASSVPWLLYLLYTGVLLVLGGIAFVTLLWMLDAWRTPASLSQGGLPSNDLEPAHSFSLIVAARHEEGVLETTLARLVTSDHPSFEVLVVVGTDDPLTLEVAERAAEHHPERIKVRIPGLSIAQAPVWMLHQAMRLHGRPARARARRPARRISRTTVTSHDPGPEQQSVRQACYFFIKEHALVADSFGNKIYILFSGG